MNFGGSPEPRINNFWQFLFAKIYELGTSQDSFNIHVVVSITIYTRDSLRRTMKWFTNGHLRRMKFHKSLLSHPLSILLSCKFHYVIGSTSFRGPFMLNIIHLIYCFFSEPKMSQKLLNNYLWQKYCYFKRFFFLKL